MRAMVVRYAAVEILANTTTRQPYESNAMSWDPATKAPNRIIATLAKPKLFKNCSKIFFLSGFMYISMRTNYPFKIYGMSTEFPAN